MAGLDVIAEGEKSNVPPTGFTSNNLKGRHMTKDWAKLVADLERLLKLRNPPFGMKLFERAEDMEAIPRIRRPKVIHAFDQVVAQAARLGWTVGVPADN